MFEIIVFIVVFLPIIGGSIALYFYFKKSGSELDEQFRTEAGASGATFWKGRSSDSIFKSILLNEGRSSYIQRLLVYRDGAAIGEASFRFNDLLIAFNFASFPIAKYDPLWLVVDSRKNNMSGRSLMDMAKVSGKLNFISLEGNFRDTYKVYVNTGQQLAALTALNPASMEKLVYFFDKYDIEIANNRLFIYSRGSELFYTSEFRRVMIEDVKALAAVLQ